MNRLRHGYVEIAPAVAPYLVTSIYDDPAGVLVGYGSPSTQHLLGAIAYGLTTSAGMVALIVALVSGVLAGVAGLLLGWTGAAVLTAGGLVAVIVFVALFAWAYRVWTRAQVTLPARFPTPPGGAPRG